MAQNIEVGTKVTYTNRKGTVITGTVIDLIAAEIYGKPCAIVEWDESPATYKGDTSRKVLADLVPIA